MRNCEISCMHASLAVPCPSLTYIQVLRQSHSQTIWLMSSTRRLSQYLPQTIELLYGMPDESCRQMYFSSRRWQTIIVAVLEGYFCFARLSTVNIALRSTDELRLCCVVCGSCHQVLAAHGSNYLFRLYCP